MRVRSRGCQSEEARHVNKAFTLMKALVQRVARAGVSVDGVTISSVGRGLCVLVGIHRDDTDQQAKVLAKKIAALRVFEDPDNSKRWSKSVSDLGLEVLCVSQFTLYHTMKGYMCRWACPPLPTP